MLYMLLICYDPTLPIDPAEPNRQPEHAKLEAELRKEGTYVSGGALWPALRSKVVPGDGRGPMACDGPFAETKEVLGGYFMVECDEDEALRIAARIPIGRRGWIRVQALGLFHPDVERIRRLGNYVDPRLARMVKTAD